MYKYIFLILFFVTLSSADALEDSADTNFENKANEIEKFFLLHENIVSNDKAIITAQDVIQNRTKYSNSTIARAFIVLANIAYNKGDSSQAFQFALDGLSLSGLSDELKLNLILKITKGYYKELQFEEVLEHADLALKLTYGIEQVPTRIIALSYKAMALSTLGEPEKANTILNKIELLIQNNQFFEHISVLEILADAYLFQRDFQTAISLYNKVITLKFDRAQLINLGHTFLSLAKAYHSNDKLDDAYNAYWESRVHAGEYNLPIQAALADLGLGQVLYQQEKFTQAYKVLKEAYSALSKEDLVSSYLDTLIALAMTSEKVDSREQENWLEKVQKLAQGRTLTPEQIVVFKMLAEMSFKNEKFKEAYVYQARYLSLFKAHFPILKPTLAPKHTQKSSVSNNRQLVMKLSDHSDLSVNYETKFKKQEMLIFWLSFVLIIVLTVLIIIWVRRNRKTHEHYSGSAEFNGNTIASPNQTKQLYQFMFKMARKYQYPLTISYIVVENWNELAFHFDKKTVKEVNNTLSTLISEYINEFDRAGKINDGEYILMCPHQHSKVIQSNLGKLAEALKVRFFANIGDFSVKIKYSCDMPSVQDIDPYLFLSRLSESHSKTSTKK